MVQTVLREIPIPAISRRSTLSSAVIGLTRPPRCLRHTRALEAADRSRACRVALRDAKASPPSPRPGDDPSQLRHDLHPVGSSIRSADYPRSRSGRMPGRTGRDRWLSADVVAPTGPALPGVTSHSPTREKARRESRGGEGRLSCIASHLCVGRGVAHAELDAHLCEGTFEQRLPVRCE